MVNNGQKSPCLWGMGEQDPSAANAGCVVWIQPSAVMHGHLTRMLCSLSALVSKAQKRGQRLPLLFPIEQTFNADIAIIFSRNSGRWGRIWLPMVTKLMYKGLSYRQFRICLILKVWNAHSWKYSIKLVLWRIYSIDHRQTRPCVAAFVSSTSSSNFLQSHLDHSATWHKNWEKFKQRQILWARVWQRLTAFDSHSSSDQDSTIDHLLTCSQSHSFTRLQEN